MSNPLDITLHASAAETGDGVGESVDVGALRRAARLILDVSVAGTSLDVSVETSRTGTGWKQVGTFPTVTSVGPVDLTVGNLERYVRVSWTATGPVTFDVSGEAHVVYAEAADVRRYGIPEDALANVTDAELTDACIADSGEADGYLAAAFELPLTAWGTPLTKHVAKLAVLTTLSKRGFQPDGPDDVVMNGHALAMQWLDRIATGRIKPPDIVDSTPEMYEAAAAVVSRPRRQ